ncbi:MAG: hypothetical protein ABI182_00280 [Candidatus Baltobacteraceae bacterium]
MRIIQMAACVCALILGMEGCAGSVERWIVNTRVNQGASALDRGNLHESLLAYQLALRVGPNDPRARAGFSAVSMEIADNDYKHAHFDDALATLNAAAKYDPGSVRVEALRSQIEQAKLKREIVVSNYPTYSSAGAQIAKAYISLAESNAALLHSLKRFNYSYDTNDLTKAIQQSYELNLEVAKNTNRLIAYRQLVESGVPEAAKGQQSLMPAASLLPLP